MSYLEFLLPLMVCHTHCAAALSSQCTCSGHSHQAEHSATRSQYYQHGISWSFSCDLMRPTLYFMDSALTRHMNQMNISLVSFWRTLFWLARCTYSSSALYHPPASVSISNPIAWRWCLLTHCPLSPLATHRQASHRPGRPPIWKGVHASPYHRAFIAHKHISPGFCTHSIFY